jgi:ribosomal protein S1
VRNIVDFGAFVDVGLKNDGLVHKSQMGQRRVTNVFDVVSIGQQVEVTVLDVDMERKRVSLGMKKDIDVPLKTSKVRVVKNTSVQKSYNEYTGAGMTSRISFG